MKYNNEPIFKQKDYSKEQYESKKTKSFGVAKRIIIMSQLSYISLVNSMISLVLFLVLVLGTGAIPYLTNIEIDFSGKTFIFRGGLFSTISMNLVVLFAITSFWYAIGYKKLEIMCIHLDGSLKGAAEVNVAAQIDHFKNCTQKGSGLKSASYSSIAGVFGIAENYLLQNGIKMVGINALKKLNMVIIFGQIIIAVVCVLVLIK